MTYEPHDSRLIDRLGSAARDRLLEYLLSHTKPRPERRVFVNRTLRMGTISTIGFDLDWTLADYKRLPFEHLTFQLAVERLIDHHGYPNQAREAVLRPEFPRRGLLIDKEAGTVLGISRHRFVNRAYHGRDRLDREELKRLYRYEPVRPTSDRFYHLDSLFELPEANLYAELVELAKQDDSLPTSPRVIFEDVRAAIDWVHAEGALKGEVLADPHRYLEKEDALVLALCRLALAGRRLILLTNSGWSYADGLCSYLFEGLLPGLESWQQLFDLVIVDSGKPGFFRQRRTFTELGKDGEEIDVTEVPKWGGVYREGCHDGLMQLIDDPGEKVLYVGDHIYGDIVSSKRDSTWRTALIVRELEEEISSRRTTRREIEKEGRLTEELSRLGQQMDHLRDVVTMRQSLTTDGRDNGELKAARSEYRKVAIKHRRVLAQLATRSDKLGAGFNPYWDSFFKQGPSKTRFASQIETYACLYTSRVTNFGSYGTDHYFRVAHDPMAHELNG